MTDIEKIKKETFDYLTYVYLNIIGLEIKLKDSDSTEDQRRALRNIKKSIRKNYQIFDYFTDN